MSNSADLCLYLINFCTSHLHSKNVCTKIFFPRCSDFRLLCKFCVYIWAFCYSFILISWAAPLQWYFDIWNTTFLHMILNFRWIWLNVYILEVWRIFKDFLRPLESEFWQQFRSSARLAWMKENRDEQINLKELFVNAMLGWFSTSSIYAQWRRGHFSSWEGLRTVKSGFSHECFSLHWLEAV